MRAVRDLDGQGKLWGDLSFLAEVDPWDKPYRVVMPTAKGGPLPSLMSPVQVRAVIDKLFVTSPPPPLRLAARNRRLGLISGWLVRGTTSPTLEGLDDQLIGSIMTKIKGKKAPCMNAVPSEVALCMARARYTRDGSGLHSTRKDPIFVEGGQNGPDSQAG